MIAIASIVYLVLTLSAPNGAPFFVTPVYAIIASWALSRAGLPFALVPVLGISLAQGMLELMPVVTFLITGQFAEQILPVFVDLLVLLGLVAWTIRARSRRAVIALMIYHLLALLVPVFFILSGAITLAAFALPIVMKICAVTAGCLPSPSSDQQTAREMRRPYRRPAQYHLCAFLRPGGCHPFFLGQKHRRNRLKPAGATRQRSR